MKLGQIIGTDLNIICDGLALWQLRGGAAQFSFRQTRGCRGKNCQNLDKKRWVPPPRSGDHLDMTTANRTMVREAFGVRAGTSRAWPDPSSRAAAGWIKWLVNLLVPVGYEDEAGFHFGPTPAVNRLANNTRFAK